MIGHFAHEIHKTFYTVFKEIVHSLASNLGYVNPSYLFALEILLNVN